MHLWKHDDYSKSEKTATLSKYVVNQHSTLQRGNVPVTWHLECVPSPHSAETEAGLARVWELNAVLQSQAGGGIRKGGKTQEEMAVHMYSGKADPTKGAAPADRNSP